MSDCQLETLNVVLALLLQLFVLVTPQKTAYFCYILDLQNQILLAFLNRPLFVTEGRRGV